jgi:hypothetical protein
VKKEDLDWWIYHLLVDEPDQDISALSEKTRCKSGEVAESLRRLEKIFLVEQCKDKYRIRSIHEMLLTCHARNDENTPFIIENGIIKERKRPG